MPKQRLTADKRQNFILPKLPLATSFIRKTLSETQREMHAIQSALKADFVFERSILLLREDVDETYVFFPLVNLEAEYRLKYGDIGPASILIKKYPRILKILPALKEATVDGKNIKDPVFAASTMDFKKFIDEMECIAFLTEHNPSAEEIFVNKVMFTIHNEDGKEKLYIDKYALFSSDDITGIILQNFPKDYRRWDTDSISKFESEISDTINSDFYKALIYCLSDEQDKEVAKEKRRIIVSIMLFNEAFINLAVTHPFSNIQIVLIAAAFEALLNLPPEAIASSFEQAITTMVGKKTTMLKKWCKTFYHYRSSLVHGDIDWNKDEKSFMYFNKEGPPYSNIAKNLFIHCLRTKLYLMGVYSEYKRENFDFDNYINSWQKVLFQYIKKE